MAAEFGQNQSDELGGKGRVFSFAIGSTTWRLRTTFCKKFVKSLLLVVLDVHAEDSYRICGEQGVTDVSNTYQLLKVTTLRSVETSGYTVFFHR
jgi:hypothetical protein